MKIKKLLIILLFAIVPVLFTSCSSLKKMKQNAIAVQVIKTFNTKAPVYFYDLIHGVQIQVKSAETQPKSNTDLYTLMASKTPQYIKSMGFKEIDNEKDYLLTVTIYDIDVNTFSGLVNTSIGVKMTDSKGSEVFSQDSRASLINMMNLGRGVSDCYTKALEQIQWNEIATILK